MRNDTHNTLIDTVRTAVEDWRKREGWSRASAGQEIVAKHEEIGGPLVTGIVFDPNTKDTYERQRINGERIFRWLDNITKDTNLLPVNFLPSILAALPSDLQMQVLGALVRPLGLQVSSCDAAKAPAFDPLVHAGSLIKEGSEAAQAVLKVGADAPAALVEQACKELDDVSEAACVIKRAIRAAAAVVGGQ